MAGAYHPRQVCSSCQDCGRTCLSKIEGSNAALTGLNAHYVARNRLLWHWRCQRHVQHGGLPAICDTQILQQPAQQRVQVFDAQKAAVREVERLLQRPDDLRQLPALLEENTRKHQVCSLLLSRNKVAGGAQSGAVVKIRNKTKLQCRSIRTI